MTERSTSSASATTEEPARKSTPPSRNKGSPAAPPPRRTKLGDVTGSTRPKRIARLTVKDTVIARQQAKFAALRDILGQAGKSRKARAVGLRAILEGAAPDAS